MKAPLTSPKLKGSSKIARAHWYPYYAGYSPDFVVDVLKRLAIRPGSDKRVVDPWNGSGTTTSICSMRSILSTGFDINPAMVVVSKARLLDANISDSLDALLAAILTASTRFRGDFDPKEPLRAWFRPATADRIRSIERAIGHLTLSQETLSNRAELCNRMSSLAAFFYVLMFRLIRDASRRMAVSNPTWTKKAADEAERVQMSFGEIESRLRADLREIRLAERAVSQLRRASAEISLADSTSIPLESGVADAIISSPPYCTRIDYAVATRMELALLGIGRDEDLRLLRSKMIGTTLSARPSTDFSPPQYVQEILEAIKMHPSKASKSYYHSTYFDYFQKLGSSLSEVARISSRSAKVVLVVQDSVYKDIHVDLAKATAEFMGQHHFNLHARTDFACGLSMRDIGRSHKETARPVESVLFFSRD